MPDAPTMPPQTITTHSGRHINPPAHFADFLPNEDNPLEQIRTSPPVDTLQSTRLMEYRTQSDSMGCFCVYPNQPTFIPTGDGDIHVVVDAPTLQDSQKTGQQHSLVIYGLSEPEIT